MDIRVKSQQRSFYMNLLLILCTVLATESFIVSRGLTSSMMRRSPITDSRPTSIESEARLINSLLNTVADNLQKALQQNSTANPHQQTNFELSFKAKHIQKFLYNIYYEIIRYYYPISSV